MHARVVATAFAGLVLAACSKAPSGLPATLQWAFDRQAADGLWHSETYGLLARGESTTATLAFAIASLPAGEWQPWRSQIERALRALLARNAPSVPEPPEPIDYPIFTAAHLLHALALVQPHGWRDQVPRLLAFLQQHQLHELQGWQPQDPEYGGFGLGDRQRDKPQGAELIGLAAVTAVLEALAAAGVATDHVIVRRGRAFVQRCQQFGGDGDDGGFCYAPTGDWRATKAGTRPGHDGRARPVSYGTATADGIRALLRSGDDLQAPRVRAAVAWLHRHRDGITGPGLAPDLEPSLRLYWLQTCARALASTGQALPAAVHQQLAALRQADGSYRGLGILMKEDDPLVATALAILALGAVLERS